MADPDRQANRPELKAIRRDLRRHATPAERALWQALKGRGADGLKFRRQHSVGRYVLDFYCPTEKLAVELDGAVHADPARAAHDAERQSHLEGLGIRVLRFENRTVLEAPDLVAAAIADDVRQRQAGGTTTPDPSPQVEDAACGAGPSA